MKRRLLLLFIIISALFAAISLTSCGERDEHIHSFDYDTVSLPDCVNFGLQTIFCEGCGECYNEVIAPLGHAYSKKTVDPTCESDGYSVYSCARCGDSYTSDMVPALGHDYHSEEKSATCAEGGYIKYTCSNCNGYYVENEVEKLSHDYEVSVISPTCLSEGYTLKTCKLCGDEVKENYTAKSDHGYVLIKEKLPSSTEEGYRNYECSQCGASYSETLDKVVHVHSYKGVITKSATCETSGVNTFTCSLCGDSYEEEIPKTSHKYESVTIKEPTYGEEGLKRDTCVYCGAVIETVIPVKDHEHEYEAVSEYPSSCTEDGVVTYSCKYCGDSYTQKIALIGHRYGDWLEAKAPTLKNSGLLKSYCLNDSSHVKEIVLPVLNKDDYNYLESGAKGVYTYTVDSQTFRYEVELCTDENSFVFNYDAVEGYYEVVSYSGSEKNIIIPSTYENKPVSRIARRAFYGNTVIESVNTGAVTVISGRAFEGCTSLKSVVFGAELIYIDVKSFSGCTSLTSAEFTSQSNWVLTDTVTETAISVSDAQVNAQKLIGAYAEYIIKKN